MIKPDAYIQTIEDALEEYYVRHLQDSSEEWEARNSGDTISGSGFSKCVRLCWYRWFDEASKRQPKDPAYTDKLDIKSKRNMFFGLLVEDFLIKALRERGIPGGGIIHKDQTGEPVVVTDEVNGITRSAANDMVLEGLDEEGKYYIPTECKTTDRGFSFRDPKNDGKWTSPAQWWDSFTGYLEHKRQVMQWIWLARRQGWRVPFGIIFYLRRNSLDTKYILIDVSGDAHIYPEADEIIDYFQYEEELTQRNEQLVTSISLGIEPTYDETVPDIMCKGCNYLERCKQSR